VSGTPRQRHTGTTHTSDSNNAKRRRCSRVESDVCAVADDVEDTPNEDKGRIKQYPALAEPSQSKGEDSESELKSVANEENTLEDVEKELGPAVGGVPLHISVGVLGCICRTWRLTLPGHTLCSCCGRRRNRRQSDRRRCWSETWC
jgi:hypothetical protein